MRCRLCERSETKSQGGLFSPAARTTRTPGDDCAGECHGNRCAGRSVLIHQSAESRMSVNRRRCRLRHPTAATTVTTIRASPTPTMTSSDAQLLGTHNFRATRAAVTATVKIKSFMGSRRHREHENKGTRPLTSGTPRKRTKGIRSTPYRSGRDLKFEFNPPRRQSGHQSLLQIDERRISILLPSGQK